MALKAGRRLAVCIPARNEAPTIGGVVSAARRLQRVGLVDDLVEVDDESSDATGSRARTTGATVVRSETGPGKGQALTSWHTAVSSGKREQHPRAPSAGAPPAAPLPPPLRPLRQRTPAAVDVDEEPTCSPGSSRALFAPVLADRGVLGADAGMTSASRKTRIRGEPRRWQRDAAFTSCTVSPTATELRSRWRTDAPQSPTARPATPRRRRPRRGARTCRLQRGLRWSGVK